MRILFLRHPMRNVGGTGVYTKLLIKEFVRKKHIIGLWPTDGMVYKELFDLPIIRLESNLRRIESYWDVIIIQHTQTLFYAKHIIQQMPDVPHVFISHSSLSNDQVLPYPQLNKIIMIADTIQNNWGVPDEIKEVIFNPLSIPEPVPYRRKTKTPYNILLISRLNPDRVELVRDIVFTINQMPDCKLKVIGGGIDYMLRSIANKNIVFEGEQQEVDKYYREADIVIGSGRTAVEAMANGKPVIIAGLRGLGGLVTQNNYDRFKKIMFSGRFDGRLNERIPKEGLIASIRSVLLNNNLERIVGENYSLVKNDFDQTEIAKKIEDVLVDAVKLNSLVNDPDRIIHLKPKLVNNCDIIREDKNGSFQIIRLVSGQKLGYVNFAGRKLISDFRGKHSLIHHANRYGCQSREDLDEIIEATKKLWTNKIITFY